MVVRMIRINLDNKKEKIEEIFWKWFKKCCLDEFCSILENDVELQKIIFKTSSKYYSWKEKNTQNFEKDYSILRRFFLSTPKEHIELSQKIFNIKKNTKNFFLRKYDSFRRMKASEIVEALGIKTCPYCNKNFIDIYINKSGQKKLNGDMDHYLPKSKYPYLSICLYNLIPVCKSCNQEKGKNPSEKLHFHPYGDSGNFGYSFKTIFDEENIDLNYIYGLSNNFKIELDCTGNEYMENSKEIFHLEDKYKNSKEQAKSIIRSAYIYNSRYIRDMLKDYFINSNDESCVKLGCEEEIAKLIFDYEEEESINRPLGKLKYDLLKEFGVIK